VSAGKRILLIVVGAILGAAFLGTIAFALTVDDPTDDGIVKACYDTGGKKAGKIRLVNAESDCKDTENFLQWPIVDEISDLDGTVCHIGEYEGTLDISFDPDGTGHLTCVVPDACEGVSTGDVCVNENGFGECSGVIVCDSLSGATSCDAPIPAAESCGDSIDNDCDGTADEDCNCEDPGAVESCVDLENDPRGQCLENAAGTRTCSPEGTWGACEGEEPLVESCDGEDNDCDDIVDEGFDVGESCTVGSDDGTKVCNGEGSGTFCST
jgi:hypothetical protein